MAEQIACPNCGLANIPERTVCKQCRAPLYVAPSRTFADLIALRQLTFLVDETTDWPEATSVYREPYIEQLAALKARAFPELVPGVAAAAEPVTQWQGTSPAPSPSPATTPAPPAAKREPVPFDQWLLSERNIKIALYAGGLLLVLAGLIFVGVNWTYFSGPAKFAVTFLFTGLMYLGGYLLYQRPALRLGSVAVLGVASGFVPLNFAVLQIYVLSERAVDGEVMWLIASPICLLLYALTAVWTRAHLFTYLAGAALASAATAALAVIDAPLAVYLLVYALLTLIYLLGARAFDRTRLADVARAPLLIVSQVGAPLVFLNTLAYYQDERSWLLIVAMTVLVIHYVATDLLFPWLAARIHWLEALAHWFTARWVAALLFVVLFVLTLAQLHVSAIATGIALQGLALAYLGVGYTLERRADTRTAGLPLYIAGYVVAGFVTLQALATLGRNPADLAKALLGDVIVLAASAAVYRRYEWIYGAAWLLIAPVFIYADLYLGGAVDQGLALGVLMLNYVAAGYALGRRALRLGGPFLSAAAALSLAVVALTWSDSGVASAALAVIAALYLLIALWLTWPWLLIPALAAVNLAVMTVASIALPLDLTWMRVVTVSGAVLGSALTIGGLRLERAGQRRWAWPLYLIGAGDVALAYMVGLTLGRPLAIGLSVAFATLALWLAWAKQADFAALKLPPVLTYVGLAMVFVGQLYVISLSVQAWQIWPVYSVLLCALFVALAWLLHRGRLSHIYSQPLRLAGLGLTLVSLIGVVFVSTFDSPLIAATFAISGTLYAADAAARRQLYLGYLGGAALLLALWAILWYAGVAELQAYTLPFGLALVALGWNERRHGVRTSYRAATLLGLLILMGSAFIQSLDSVIYAVLLLIEGAAAVGWGARTHSRGYVEVGVLSLLANALAQFGPAFVELPRWVQLGSIGALLLGSGLAALFRREQILTLRRAVAGEWKRWEP